MRVVVRGVVTPLPEGVRGATILAPCSVFYPDGAPFHGAQYGTGVVCQSATHGTFALWWDKSRTPPGFVTMPVDPADVDVGAS